MFESKGTIYRKPSSRAFSASSSSEADVDDEFDESFIKGGMLPTNKTLPTKLIVYTKSAKTNKRYYNSKLINAITVTKQEHSIHSRL